ncbi:MAG: epoxide hydrolase, partial [Glaciihabitans sp.]|nr:epoxide hydrolase [Glaciihabitans sp.]
GVHVNGSLGMPTQQLDDNELASLTALERDRYSRVQDFMRDELGYIAIQSTRPQTLAAALVDSPVGQLAWIVDKFMAWTFPWQELPDRIVGRDRLLTNVMLYWLTGTAGSSAFVGYAQPTIRGAVKEISGVPTGVLLFAHDVGIRRYAELENRITHWTDIEDRGGHFAAMEEPDLMVRDIVEFFEDKR